ncbi:Protein of unknown function DM4/12 [Trinorchestia longiramus]|nr:Protein of unknown function DM4/12 [Trinorchestia longiramus]
MTTPADAVLVLGGLVGPSIAAAALAGAVALGIGALALSKRRKSHGYGHGYGHGHGHGHGGGHGHHGHSSDHGYDRSDVTKAARYGHKRRKREVVGNEQQRGEMLMQVIRQQDTTGCGLKMVCQLAALDEDELAEEELAVMNLVQFVPPGESRLPTSGADDYHTALSMGRTGGNCTHVYASCPIDGIRIMDTVMAFLP